MCLSIIGLALLSSVPVAYPPQGIEVALFVYFFWVFDLTLLLVSTLATFQQGNLLMDSKPDLKKRSR